MPKEYYNTINTEGTAEFKDRGSKFIAYAFPIANVEQFKQRLQQLKKDHPKAVHHCFAYRLGTDGNLFRSNDDGEPSGTAGKPILGQLDSKEITDAAVVVVRYFGGSLLGVPGLINAYKTSASLALQMVPTVQKPILVSFSLHFAYPLINVVMGIIKQCNAEINKQEMQLFCDILVGVPASFVDVFTHKIADLREVELTRNK